MCKVCDKAAKRLQGLECVTHPTKNRCHDVEALCTGSEQTFHTMATLVLPFGTALIIGTPGAVPPTTLVSVRQDHRLCQAEARGRCRRCNTAIP